MPRVLKDSDALAAHMALLPTCDERETLPQRLPACPQERSPVLAWLGRLFLPVPRPRRQAYGVPVTSQFVAPLDILARDYPDIHLWIMAGLG
jgi:hypothetical protein